MHMQSNSKIITRISYTARERMHTQNTRLRSISNPSKRPWCVIEKSSRFVSSHLFFRKTPQLIHQDRRYTQSTQMCVSSPILVNESEIIRFTQRNAATIQTHSIQLKTKSTREWNERNEKTEINVTKIQMCGIVNNGGVSNFSKWYVNWNAIL